MVWRPSLSLPKIPRENFAGISSTSGYQNITMNHIKSHLSTLPFRFSLESSDLTKYLVKIEAHTSFFVRGKVKAR